MSPERAPVEDQPDRVEGTPTDGRRSAAAARRRAREAQIIRATRELFDARGLRDAQIEDIARAVGINRAIVYRHFTGKEEIFALTLVDYLEELRAALVAADPTDSAATERLRAVVGAFVEYGVHHPAFVDCAHALMRRRGPELGRQWPMLIAGGLSFLVGVSYVVRAAGDQPSLDVLTVYATGGGVFFIVQALLLAWRSRQQRHAAS